MNPVRVAVLGCDSWANRTHIPNLIRLEGAEVVALCDVDPEALQATAERFGIACDGIAQAHTYLDALFSEKPQALTMGVARAIDAAIRLGGALSTVCFRADVQVHVSALPASFSGGARRIDCTRATFGGTCGARPLSEHR